MGNSESLFNIFCNDMISHCKNEISKIRKDMSLMDSDSNSKKELEGQIKAYQEIIITIAKKQSELG